MASFAIYQGESRTSVPVTLKTQIQDAAGKMVVEKTETIGVDRFGTSRAARIEFPVPLSTLAPGPYLMTFEASIGSTTVKRDVVFQIK